MSFNTKVGRFGKIKIPKEILEKLQLGVGDHVSIEVNRKDSVTEKTLSELENSGIPTSRKLYALKKSSG